jgi:hypothetical protein
LSSEGLTYSQKRKKGADKIRNTTDKIKRSLQLNYGIELSDDDDQASKIQKTSDDNALLK